MENKEYRENQKKQRKEFKKYRKAMWKVAGFFLFAVASAFIFPENLFAWLYTALKGAIGEYLAGSVAVWAQILGMGVGVLGGVVNAFKASRAKYAIDKAQDDEEDIVDALINEKDNLQKKVESLEKTKEKVITESKTNTKTESYSRSSDEYEVEEEKTKVKTR